MKENSFNYKVLAIFIFGFGLLMFERGFFWTKEQNTVLNDSEFYLALHQVIGGSGNAIYYFLLTSASVFNAINWLTPVQFATLAMINALIAFNGGADVARKR